MQYLELRRLLQATEGMERIRRFYGVRNGALVAQTSRYAALVKRHEDAFNHQGEVMVISAPGRTEILGNHTDHNAGRVLAAAINLDTLAVVSPREDREVRVLSEGYPEITLNLTDLSPREDEQGTSAGLIRGVADRMQQLGYQVGGFDAVVSSQVLSGSGLSSSAAFEVMVGCALDELYNGGRMPAVQRAQIAQYAENVHFGKPSGLMDQMASSVGGMTGIDFRVEEPEIEALSYDFSAEGYALVVVNTGGSHDDLTDEYAAIKLEMLEVAHYFEEPMLRRVRPEQLMLQMKPLREAVGDRAVLRALHFFNENKRVDKALKALKEKDTELFLQQVRASGQSSWELLQNMAVSKRDQPLAVSLALAEELLQGRGASRLHGGGFAGTTLHFVPLDLLDDFTQAMNAVFGDHACEPLAVRQDGAARVF